RSRCQRRSEAEGSPQSPRRAAEWLLSSGTSISRQCVESTTGPAACAAAQTPSTTTNAKPRRVGRKGAPELSVRLWTMLRERLHERQSKFKINFAREKASAALDRARCARAGAPRLDAADAAV